MATSKTLTPTNVTIQIPAFADKPDQRVNSNCIDKEADAINALSDQIANLIKVKQENITSDSNSTMDLGLSGSSYNVISCNAESTTNVVCIPYLHNGAWRARLINATTGAALSEGTRTIRTYYTDK